VRPTPNLAITSRALTAPMTATHATTDRSLSVTTSASPGRSPPHSAQHSTPQSHQRALRPHAAERAQNLPNTVAINGSCATTAAPDANDEYVITEAAEILHPRT
jgi:hypothetical protein